MTFTDTKCNIKVMEMEGKAFFMYMKVYLKCSDNRCNIFLLTGAILFSQPGIKCCEI